MPMSADAFYPSLKQRLQAGEWVAGQRLPSIRTLVARHGASYHTVVRACARLVSEGLLVAQPGRGYFVAGQAAVAAPLAPEFTMNDPLFKLLQGGPQYTKLGCGWLPAVWRDTDLLTKAIRRTARLEQHSLVEYGDISGHLPLRQQLSVHLKRMTRVEACPSQILTTLGATQALDLVARLLITPGDRVFVDEPCNGNLIKLLQLAGAQVIGIPRLQDGPDVVAMAQHLARHPVKAFFCNSTFHNPTGGNIAPHNAFKVLGLAVAHDMMVVEDDVYGDFSTTPRQTLAELDALNRVIYIGSFSKCLSASLRVGYIACARDFIEPLTRLKLLTCVAVPAFCERFVNTILADGTYAGHMKDLQQKLIARQALTQRALRTHGWTFDIVPAGGMFLWASHPELSDLHPFMQALERQRVLLMPGSSFSVTRDYRHLARINCTHFTPALERLFSVESMRG